METLNYKVLEGTGYNGYILKDAPVKVMQFGEGNFLRAFVDYFYDIANEKAGYNGKVKLVQPISNFPQMADWINEQEGLYTLYLRGSEKGQKVDAKRVISCVSDCVCPYIDGKWDEVLELARSADLETIVSNTTEAGIAYTQGDSQFDQVPPNSFPAKLTRVLFERYKAFNGAADKGLAILSCELIDHNGEELEKCCEQYADLWNLGDEFKAWLKKENDFCSTLVDRIVTGFPRDEHAALCERIGEQDNMMDTAEIFHLWVIGGHHEDELPFQKAGYNVVWTDDVHPYKKRKVRILNGGHTSMVLGAHLYGLTTVGECMQDETVSSFLKKCIFEEIIPTLPLDKKDLEEFASAVEDRFNNPFVNHELMSISLNSTSKWKARNMPSFLAYIEEQKQLPKCLTMSLAAYIAFYSSDIQERTADGLICKRPAGNTYKIQDDAWALDFYYAHKDDTAAQLVHAVLTNTQMWDQDLTKIEGLEAAVLADLEMIRTQGAEAAYKSCL